LISWCLSRERNTTVRLRKYNGPGRMSSWRVVGSCVYKHRILWLAHMRVTRIVFLSSNTRGTGDRPCFCFLPGRCTRTILFVGRTWPPKTRTTRSRDTYARTGDDNNNVGRVPSYSFVSSAPCFTCASIGNRNISEPVHDVVVLSFGNKIRLYTACTVARVFRVREKPLDGWNIN